jgi:hypothetical protein
MNRAHTNQTRLRNGVTGPVMKGQKMAANLGPIKVQKTALDLSTFTEVTVGKPEIKFSPVTNLHEANARLGNNAEKLIDIINEGLRAEEQRIYRNDPSGYMMFDDDGKITDKPFSGVLADKTIVNSTILNLAKTVFDYNAVDSPEHRKAAKEKAMEFIKSNEVIRTGLAKNAGFKDEE